MNETEKYVTVIIGARIIGCAVALELSSIGHKTLNAEMLPAAGYGSTSNGRTGLVILIIQVVEN